MSIEQSTPVSEAIAPSLELPKTRLSVTGDELLRMNTRGGIAMRLPLSTIKHVDFRARLATESIVITVVGLGVGAVGYLVSTNNVLTSLLYVAALLLIGFALIGAQSWRIEIMGEGKVISIQCNDLNDEGQGFVASLQLLIGNAKAIVKGTIP